jgi:predicted flap endonuclease-1-like 5' DNA nuclease
MGVLIAQMVGCLLVAAAIGIMMGWLLRSFATSEKRQQLSEIAARLRGREHELDTLNHELKVRTSAVQMLEGKIMTSEAALKDLQAELAGKVQHEATLHMQVNEQAVRLHAAERERDTLRLEVESAEAALRDRASGYADMQAQLEAAQDLLVSRDQEISTLKSWVEQLAPKDAEIARLRGRVQELDSFVERVRQLERTLEQERTGASAAMQGKDRDLEQLASSLRRQDELLAQLRQEREENRQRIELELAAKDREIERLRTAVQEVESLRAQVEKQEMALRDAEERRVMDVSEREEEISALRKRLVEYRVAQKFGRPSQTGDTAAGPKTVGNAKASPPQTPAEKDDLKKIHGIGPVMERVLNRMGMFTFRQIAAWDQHDIEHVASELNTFPDRIHRDKWVDGAKQQHFLKYGEEL